MRALRSVLVELGREKHRGGLEDLVGPAQLVDLFAQLLDLLALGRGRQIRAQALVSLHLAQPPAQRLRRHAEVLSDVRDRATALQDQASAAVEQLRRVLPWTSHGAEDFLSPGTEPWNRALRQTQPGSKGSQGSNRTERCESGDLAQCVIGGNQNCDYAYRSIVLVEVGNGYGDRRQHHDYARSGTDRTFVDDRETRGPSPDREVVEPLAEAVPRRREHVRLVGAGQRG